MGHWHVKLRAQSRGELDRWFRENAAGPKGAAVCRGEEAALPAKRHAGVLTSKGVAMLAPREAGSRCLHNSLNLHPDVQVAGEG